MHAPLALALAIVLLPLSACASHPSAPTPSSAPFLLVLGIAQDGGVPQAGAVNDPRWNHPDDRRLVSCLALIDPQTNQRWLFDATPDLPEQLTRLHRASPFTPAAPLNGIFLTHAHMGHYTGLLHLGHESMSARSIPVYAAPRMRDVLESHAPWGQLVRYHNISLHTLTPDVPIHLTDTLSVTPFLVPHRQEYSEVLAFRIQAADRAAIFIPDIDSWDHLDAAGTRIEELIASADVAYLDGTFFSAHELPGRDMSKVPHPLISTSLARFASLPAHERAKVRFIHLNHTNPALNPNSPEARQVRAAGMRIAQELESFPLAAP